MLSRVADSLYWMARQIERAENQARLIDVNLQLDLDIDSTDEATQEAFWGPIVKCTGDDEVFRNIHPVANLKTVTDFLTFEPSNPDSISSSIGQARENARMVRDQISDEVWFALNTLYLYLKSGEGPSLARQDPPAFFEKILGASYAIQGMIDCTIPRDEGWEFIHLGKCLERADKTTRVLDIQTYNPADQPGFEGLRSLQWMAILRSCSAFHAFQQTYRISVEIDPKRIAEFILFSHDFPRSAAFCVEEVNRSLHRISGSPDNQHVNEAERLCGKLVADLNFDRIDDVMKYGMHEYLDEIQRRLNEVGNALFNTFVLYLDPVAAEQQHKQEQQQQQ